VEGAVEGEPLLLAEARPPGQEAKARSGCEHQETHAQAGGAQYPRVASEGNAVGVVFRVLIGRGPSVGCRCVQENDSCFVYVFFFFFFIFSIDLRS